MPAHPLSDLAWKVNDLMRAPRARQWLRGQCATFLRGEESSWEYFPVPWRGGRFGCALTLQAKCTILAALHEIVCTSVESLNPAPVPPPWPADFAQGRTEQAQQAAIAAQRWAVLLDHVRNALGSEHCDDVEAWLKDVEEALNKPGDEQVSDESPTAEADEQQPSSGGKAPATPKLAPSHEIAFRQYLDAVEKNPTQLNGATDREVYDWLGNHVEAGEELPSFATWSRYLRKARDFYDAQKNTPRAGRAPGKSVVRQDQIECGERD